jgi:hypothetical protein
VFGLAVAVLTWDYVQIVPTPGLDASWILGINLAAAEGLNHGTQVVFTYGPLGFLEQPMVIDGLLATLGAIYLLAIRAAFAASLLWAARRSFPWPVAAAIALVIMAISPSTVGSVSLALTLLWALVALGRDAPSWSVPLLVYGGGALGALESMIKLNTGATIAIGVAIAVVALPGRRLRNLARFAGTFILVFAVLWFAAGQGLGNLDDYVRSSYEIISGYSQAMGIEEGAVAWDWVAALIVVAASLAAAAAGATRRATAVATVLLVGLFSFSLFKYGFVRHEPGHVAVLFGVLAVVWIAPRYNRRQGRTLAIAAIAAIALVHYPVADESVGSSFAPDTAITQLVDLAIPSERDEVADRAHDELAAVYAVPPEMLEKIGDAPVDARPWEVGLIWANDLNWRPLPVIQDYAAYTSRLDQLNADALASAAGPQYVLRHLAYNDTALRGLDGRLTTFDAPLEQRTLMCDFRATATSTDYQLLERAGDRCGPERELETVEASYGEVVQVPTAGPGEAVFARVEGAGAEGIEKLRTFLYREAFRSVALETTVARFQTATAGDGILLSLPARADFPKPFAIALDPRTIAIDSEDGFATSDGPLRFEFFAIALK